MNAKSVLLLETGGADYGAYMLARGFRDLMGRERLREWPYKRTHNGGVDHYPERVWNPTGGLPGRPSDVIHVTPEGKMGYVPSFTGCELWAHRSLWRGWMPETLPGAFVPSDGPVHFMEPLGIPEAADDEIFAMVERGEFGLIVLNGARWHGSAALHELRARFGDRLPPVAFCDHEDYPQFRVDFCQALGIDVYFKRTIIRPPGHPIADMFGPPPCPVRPLPFSSIWDVPWTPWAERKIDVFCVFGMTQWMRRKCKETAEEVASHFPGCRILSALGHALRYPEYMRTLATSKIVIDQQSYGADTVRFWEASASGALVVSDFSLEGGLVPGEHFLRYDNDLSPSGDQQDFSLLQKHLHRALTDDGWAEQLAQRGYDTVRRDHTCAARARYVVQETRAATGKEILLGT